MTSSISPPRMRLAEVSPIAQRRASTRLDLPQPLGPTTPVMPGSIDNSVSSTKVLKPLSLSLENCNGSDPSALGHGRVQRFGKIGVGQIADQLGADAVGPMMKKVGVEFDAVVVVRLRLAGNDRLLQLGVGAGIYRRRRRPCRRAARCVSAHRRGRCATAHCAWLIEERVDKGKVAICWRAARDRRCQ